MKMQNAKHKTQARLAGAVRAGGGFTLIELLVVVGIIVLLIGILVPTLGGARQKARASQTSALLSQMSGGIDTYFTRFHAYPGPLSAAQTTAASNKLSGTQNMMLGLTYGFVPALVANPPYPAANGVSFGSVGRALSTSAVGPVDLGSVRPDGKYEQLASYFSPTAKQVFNMRAAPASNSFTSPGNTFDLPVVVDAFQDALPILYYRRNVGVENPTSGSPPGYYYDENKEYTTGTLKATSGASFTQSYFTAGDLNKVVSADNSTGNKVRGGYALISAGIDRFYGPVNGKNDDLTLVGGD
jgi:type II secretory pathway pseudopilin PulG